MNQKEKLKPSVINVFAADIFIGCLVLGGWEMEIGSGGGVSMIVRIHVCV